MSLSRLFVTQAVVVGSGPNGLSAAVALARAGLSVTVLEAASTYGGGARTSDDLTLPGFAHDLCSAVHPMAIGSPFLRTLPLAEHGLKWLVPKYACAHPLDDGTAAWLSADFTAMADALGGDLKAYRNLMTPFTVRAADLFGDALGPLGIPKHPVLFARFGLKALWPSTTLARTSFRDERARALFAGIAAHSCLPLEAPSTSAIAMMLAIAGHAYGWPVPQGGAGALTEALASLLRSLGGQIETGRRVASLDELPADALVMLDLTPRQILAIAGQRLPARYARRLARYRYGPGVFKVDWALREPIPWRASACRDTVTVHVGGTLAEIAASERTMGTRALAEKPYVLVTQPSIVDPTRAPAGQHTAWGYCHVPNGSAVDMTARIEAQIERFAPGFRDVVLARHTRGPAALESYNENFVGGDINGGAVDLAQFLMRPVPSLTPYATPVKNLFICSSSTPPGPGVHGMSGYHAAKAALARL
jgi:phytoene dehydrogenase-like protein